MDDLLPLFRHAYLVDPIVGFIRQPGNIASLFQLLQKTLL